MRSEHGQKNFGMRSVPHLACVGYRHNVDDVFLLPITRPVMKILA